MRRVMAWTVSLVAILGQPAGATAQRTPPDVSRLLPAPEDLACETVVDPAEAACSASTFSRRGWAGEAPRGSHWWIGLAQVLGGDEPPGPARPQRPPGLAFLLTRRVGGTTYAGVGPVAAESDQEGVTLARLTREIRAVHAGRADGVDVPSSLAARLDAAAAAVPNVATLADRGWRLLDGAAELRRVPGGWVAVLPRDADGREIVVLSFLDVAPARR